jgi:hypothetical protein
MTYDRFDYLAKLVMSGAFVSLLPEDFIAAWLGIPNWNNSTLQLLFALGTGIALLLALKDEPASDVH